MIDRTFPPRRAHAPPTRLPTAVAAVCVALATHVPTLAAQAVFSGRTSLGASSRVLCARAGSTDPLALRCANDGIPNVITDVVGTATGARAADRLSLGATVSATLLRAPGAGDGGPDVRTEASLFHNDRVLLTPLGGAPPLAQHVVLTFRLDGRLAGIGGTIVRDGRELPVARATSILGLGVFAPTAPPFRTWTVDTYTSDGRDLDVPFSFVVPVGGDARGAFAIAMDLQVGVWTTAFTGPGNVPTGVTASSLADFTSSLRFTGAQVLGQDGQDVSASYAVALAEGPALSVPGASSVVPEPTTLVLLGGGLAALALGAARRGARHRREDDAAVR